MSSREPVCGAPGFIPSTENAQTNILAIIFLWNFGGTTWSLALYSAAMKTSKTISVSF